MDNLEDWGIDRLIKKGGVMILNPEEVNKMKTKVIKSGEKNFEEEKIKMFEPKTLNKEEQLELVFNRLLTGIFVEYDMIQYGGMSEEQLKNKYTNIFLREIKIRVKL